MSDLKKVFKIKVTNWLTEEVTFPEALKKVRSFLKEEWEMELTTVESLHLLTHVLAVLKECEEKSNDPRGLTEVNGVTQEAAYRFLMDEFAITQTDLQKIKHTSGHLTFLKLGVETERHRRLLPFGLEHRPLAEKQWARQLGL